MSTIDDHFKFFKLTHPKIKDETHIVRLGITSSAVYAFDGKKDYGKAKNQWKISKNWKYYKGKFIEIDEDDGNEIQEWKRRKITNKKALSILMPKDEE